MEQYSENRFVKGLRDGVPIGLGYLSVSFTFGMMAVEAGLPAWLALLISMTNLTSAGQFAGLSLLVGGGGLLEMAATQLVINLRYALMSLSLSQKLDAGVRLRDRLLIAFGNTDEIFAMASGQPGLVGKRYLYGLVIIPYLGWAAGTLVGAVASALLPQAVRSALGIAIYGMFLAIILPPARQMRSVRRVLLFSVALSCIIHWAPAFSFVSSGFAIILCAVAASALGAYFYPIREEGEADD